MFGNLRTREIKRAELQCCLEKAGIESGDVLLVHASLKKVGWIGGGPISLIRALRDVLGADGTLMMPTFTYSLTGWDFPPFEPRQTRSRVGMLSDTFWRLDGVQRSIHPTHSFAAEGPLADELLADPLASQPLGIGSTIDRACNAGAKILLIGVGQTTNSSVHLAESRAQMPYLKVPFAEGADYDLAKVMIPPGMPERVRITEMPGSSEGFALLEDPLRQRGLIHEVEIGEAPSQVMGMQPLCKAVQEMLAIDPLLFLRGPEPSEISLRRRAFMEDYLARHSPPGDSILESM